MCIIVKGMKKSYILLLLASMSMLVSCDFFRMVAGRPTSADIEDKKEAIVRVEQLKAEQARLDSIRVAKEQARLAEEKAKSDSLDALANIKDNNCRMYLLSSYKGLASGELQHRYYVVVGTFKEVANANKYVKWASKFPGMDPVKIHFKSGKIAVGVSPSDKVVDLSGKLADVKSKPFCPKDAWILVNE